MRNSHFLKTYLICQLPQSNTYNRFNLTCSFKTPKPLRLEYPTQQYQNFIDQLNLIMHDSITWKFQQSKYQMDHYFCHCVFIWVSHRLYFYFVCQKFHQNFRVILIVESKFRLKFDSFVGWKNINKLFLESSLNQS